MCYSRVPIVPPKKPAAPQLEIGYPLKYDGDARCGLYARACRHVCECRSVQSRTYSGEAVRPPLDEDEDAVRWHQDNDAGVHEHTNTRKHTYAYRQAGRQTYRHTQKTAAACRYAKHGEVNFAPCLETSQTLVVHRRGVDTCNFS